MIAGKKAETKDLKMIDHFSVHVLYAEDCARIGFVLSFMGLGGGSRIRFGRDFEISCLRRFGWDFEISFKRKNSKFSDSRG